MQFVTLKGRKKSVTLLPYAIDWDAPCLSKFQFAVKQFLRPHWCRQFCYEELPVAGTRMRIDFYNAGKRIAIECDGAQHNGYNRHFHRGSLSVYQMQMERDDQKEKWCALNGITLVRIYPEDVKQLSPAWFREHYEGLSL
jgi:hypothetical protein